MTTTDVGRQRGVLGGRRPHSDGNREPSQQDLFPTHFYKRYVAAVRHRVTSRCEIGPHSNLYVEPSRTVVQDLLVHNIVVRIIIIKWWTLLMATEFRDAWLESFYEHGTSHRKIPRSLEEAVFRKLQILDAAIQESDLRAPPGNRYECLRGHLYGWSSIRANRQYRLVFQWKTGTACNTYLDPHKYRN